MFRLSRISQTTKIFGVIMMSALLLWVTSVVPVVSQVSSPQIPRRGDIVKGLQGLAQTLTASEGDIWDIENAAFYSDPGVLSAAFIPLHPSSRSMQLIFQLIEGEDVGPVPFGVLYLEGDWPDPDLPLKAGIYTLKLRADRSIVAVAENEEIQICSGYWEAKPAPVFHTPVPPIIEFSAGYRPEQASMPGAPELDSLNIVTFFLGVAAVAALLTAAATIAIAVCTCRK